MSITAQGQKQRDLKKSGRCVSCWEPAQGGIHCEGCREKTRVRNRNAYRRKHGIALKAPLSKRGRKRIILAKGGKK